MIEIVAKVPGEIGESTQPGNRVSDESALVSAKFRGVDWPVVHVENERNNHVSVSRILNDAIELLPVRAIKAAVIKSGVVRIFGEFCRPWRNEQRPVRSCHDGLTVEQVRTSSDGDSQPIDFQIVEPLNTGLNYFFILPAYEPVGGGAIEKIMLAGALPNKMPGVLQIDTDLTTTVSVRRVEGAVPQFYL